MTRFELIQFIGLAVNSCSIFWSLLFWKFQMKIPEHLVKKRDEICKKKILRWNGAE